MTLDELKVKLNNAHGQLSGIYLIKEKATGEPYVGKALVITDRIVEHINNKKAKSGIDKKLAELGIDAFDFEILDLLPGADNNLLFFKEQEWIAKLDAKNNGSNLTQGNVKHTKKWLASLNKYLVSHAVSTEMMKLINSKEPTFLGQPKYTLVHEYEDSFKNRLKFDGSQICQIQSIFVEEDKNGKLKENSKELAEYIKKELDDMRLSNRTDLGEVINNPPYGYPEIADTIRKDFKYKDFYNLEPGNDYFKKEKLYQYIDTSFRPIICRNGCFKDASQVTVIAKLQKEPNSLSEIEARILLHIDTRGNEDLYTAIKEYLLKVNNIGTLHFSLSKLTRRHTYVEYDPNLFMFNAGSFDIAHGNFAVVTKDKVNWSDATNYNVFGKAFTTGSDVPAATVRGCASFKKMIYSKLGFQTLEVLFDASPEGWGLDGMFADLDYTGCNSIVEYFNRIGLSANSQAVLLAAASERTLTDKELEIVNIVEAQ